METILFSSSIPICRKMDTPEINHMSLNPIMYLPFSQYKIREKQRKTRMRQRDRFLAYRKGSRRPKVRVKEERIDKQVLGRDTMYRILITSRNVGIMCNKHELILMILSLGHNKHSILVCTIIHEEGMSRYKKRGIT